MKARMQAWIDQLEKMAKTLKREFDVYQLVLKKPETPLLGKVLLGLAVGYLLLPFDLIPDFIPILGQLDEVIIIPLLIILALRVIPKSVVKQCRDELNYTS